MAEEIVYYRVVPATEQQEFELQNWRGDRDSTVYPSWSTEHFTTEEQILTLIEEYFPGWKIEVQKKILTDWEEKR